MLRPALDGAEVVIIMVGPQQQSSRRRRLDEKTLIVIRSGTDERPRRVVENKLLNLYWWRKCERELVASTDLRAHQKHRI